MNTCHMYRSTMWWSCAASLLVGCIESAGAEFPITPDEESQNLIGRWFASTAVAEADEHYALLAKLVPLARRDSGRFAQPLVYYACHLEGEEKVSATVVYQLLLFCGVPPGATAKALGMHLYSNNQE